MDLFNQLVKVVAKKESVQNVLAGHTTESVLSTLIKAISYSDVKVALEVISYIKNKGNLEEFLNMKSTIQFKDGPQDLSALDYAIRKRDYLASQNKDEKNDNLIKGFESLITIITEKRELDNVPTVEEVEAGNGTTVTDGYESDTPSIITLSDEETQTIGQEQKMGDLLTVEKRLADFRVLPFYKGPKVDVKNYNDLTPEQLAYELADAIQKGKNDDVIGIINSDNPHVEEVLAGMLKMEDDTYRTLLIHAIAWNNVKAADAILGTRNYNTLKKLLEVKSTINYPDSGQQKVLALTFAQERIGHLAEQNKDRTNDALIKSFESLIAKIEKRTEELTRYLLSLHSNLASTIKSGNSIEHILEKSCIQDFLGDWKFDDGKGNIHTALTYAIDCDNTVAANGILAFNATSDKVTEAVLISLLMEELEVKDETGKPKKYTALSYAEKKGNTDLAQKIKQKMSDLGISILGESAVNNTIKFHALQPLPNRRAKAQGVPQPVPISKKKDTVLPHNHGEASNSGNSSGMEDIQGNSRIGDQAKVSDHSGKDGKSHISLNGDNGLKKKNEKFPSSIANDVFLAVLKGDSKHANGLLNQYKEDPALFQSGWMQILLIGDKEARELAKKDNKNIIKEIQERQGAGICLIGSAVLLVSGILTIALLSPIPILIGVSIGLAMCIGGAYHQSQEVPDTAMDKTANEKHVKLQPSVALPA